MRINIYIIIFLVISILSCTTDEKVNVSDYPIVTTIGELTNYYELNLDRTGVYEKCVATKYLDGSSELEYEYDLVDTEEFDPLFYSITIESELTIEDAIDIYEFGKTTILTANDLIGFGRIEIDSIDFPGDANYYAIRTLEGEPNGLLFMTRQDKSIYTMIVSGLYSEDHSILTDLVFPEIEKLSEFSLKN